jgi:tRNA (guanine37-N1)-methyltransferase
VKFTVVTVLPELIEPALAAGVVGRAAKAGVIEVGTVNPRDFATDRHRTVDDTPYGGGPGMVMKCEPVVAAIEAATGAGPAHRVLLTPAGAPLDQARVRALAAHPHLVLVCGRYEGIDERVAELAIDEEVSVGDFVLSGGELAALCVIDAVARLVPGVLGEPMSAADESFSAGVLEYPQYTRPLVFREREVPAILSGGNHAAIAAWRRARALERTARRRPDLWMRHAPAPGDKAAIAAARLDLAARTSIALVHHPVVDREGAVVTTALTNLDVHDIARSTSTYGLAGYYVVTPVESQRDKAAHIARMWTEDQDKEHRAQALALVHPVAAIADAIAHLTAVAGEPPLVVATSAKDSSFPLLPRTGPTALVGELAATTAPVLVLFGTGWGLDDRQIPSVSRVLAPIRGAPAWNHLSVRSAVAIVLDRLFGRRDDRSP